MKDLAKIGLPLQIAGFVLAPILLCFPRVPHAYFVAAFAVHFAGDGFFFFAMKRKKCI